MHQGGSAPIQRAGLSEIIGQAARVVDDIRFVMESSGGKVADALKADLDGLNHVEAIYRASRRADTPIELDIDHFERLMSVMLGQCLVELKGGRWVEYSGRYHVLDSSVIQLPDGKYVDVFLFCKSLWQKRGICGAMDGTSLSSFVSSADRLAFP